MQTKIKFESSVVCIMRNSNGEILILDRALQSFGWCLPGGKINNNETILGALRRLIFNQTGIQTIVTGLRFLRVDESIPLRQYSVYTYDIPIEHSMVKLSLTHSAGAFFDSNCNRQYFLAGKTSYFINSLKISISV